MGRSTIPPALVELSNPTSPEAQVNALRNLRNEVVGHDQRKELAVVHGVVKPLADILRAEARKGGKKRRTSTMNGNSSRSLESERNQEWSTEDELRFQATQVVGSLVNGGPAFVAPVFAGDVLFPLLSSLSPTETPPKLVLATLRTLNQIADALKQEKPWQENSPEIQAGPSTSSIFCYQLSTKDVVGSFAEILAQPARSYTAQQQISLVSKLISKTCSQDEERKILVEAGILDLLATKLAAMAAVDAQALRMASRPPSRDELPVMYLSDILEAISAIIRDSHYHTARFLYSQPIQQLFGSSKDRSSSYDGHLNQGTAWDRLTPRLQTMQSKADAYTKSWPALGAYQAGGSSESYTRLPSMDTLQPSGRTVITDESENALFIWLMFVARRGEGKTRLSACWLLALLKKFGEKWPLNDPSKTTRERHFAYLIVPLVVKMIEESSPESEQSRKLNHANPQAVEEHRFVLERAPLVLAEIVAGNKTLQNAAMDANFLSSLVKILKKSFDPVTSSSKPMWSPNPTATHIRDPSVHAPSSALGAPGLSPDVLHAFKYRESTLLALAALADSQDGLRKEIIQIGAATHIIESLVPYTDPITDPSSSSTGAANALSAKSGNPESVLIAACKLTRSLSRSISVLRTSLIDHGIAQPSFDLLNHPNVKVQVAATEVITNLVLEVSPMRSDILQAGALKTLCEHCRSANFDLRYGSLWALKHLCLGLPYTTKIQCLDELGVGWLVQTLNGEPTGKGSNSTPLGMGTPNAAGEQVDILNAVDDPHMDVDDEVLSDEDDETMTDNINSLRRRRQAGQSYTSPTNIRDRLQQIKNDEQDIRLGNERDDIRIQEQALDFIRNFINDEKDSGLTIDHCLKSFGHTRFFELLDSKIRPKGPSPNTPSTTTSSTTSSFGPAYWHNSSTSTSNPHTRNPLPSLQQQQQQPNWPAYPPTELIVSTLYILVHLANGPPRHRSLLISQTQLMQHVLPLLTHGRRDVRLPCAWFLNNLIWVEDNGDESATRERAQTLRQLGFEEGARLLGRDADLDIRERAKTAIEQMSKLLADDSGVGRRSAGGTGYTGATGGGPFGGSGGAGDGSGSGLGRVSGFGSLHSHHRGWGGREGGGL